MSEEILKVALERSIVALDDWVATYASEFCSEESVAAANERIGKLGTLGYIADVQEKNREALEAIAKTTSMSELEELEALTADDLRLNMGEMTAQEMRTLRAFINWRIARLQNPTKPARRVTDEPV